MLSYIFTLYAADGSVIETIVHQNKTEQSLVAKMHLITDYALSEGAARFTVDVALPQ